MILPLSVHPSRVADLLTWDRMQVRPAAPGQHLSRQLRQFLPRDPRADGRLTMSTDFVVQDSGEPDAVAPQAQQHALEDLPVEVLVYLLGSRYCETDRLSNTAWSLFGRIARRAGRWCRRSATTSTTTSPSATHMPSPTKTAYDAHTRRRGVCRDFAHLAITLCRCMNIPARYCTGYLGDIGVPLDPAPMDFSAWFEVYLGGRWYTFDARHNMPRIGRILMARGRDATDVAIVTSFGPCTLAGFKVITDEVVETPRPRYRVALALQHRRQHAIRRLVAVHEGLDVDDDLLAHVDAAFDRRRAHVRQQHHLAGAWRA